ncbi:MAG: Hpt domain-containing protein [Pirellulales bacterium]
MDMNEIKEIFFQECEEQLAELKSGLLKLNDGDRDPETVNAVFRAVHSIKGGAGAFGLDDLVSFAHVFETTLDCVRSNRLDPNQDVLKVMLKSADVLADLTNAARDGGSVEEGRTRGLVKELEALARGELPSGSDAAPAPAKPAAARRTRCQAGPHRRQRLPADSLLLRRVPAGRRTGRSGFRGHVQAASRTLFQGQ